MSESLKEPDKPETTLRHAEIIRNKPVLRKIYEDWYGSFIARAKSLPEGRILEIGSGGGFLKELMPEVYTSDILPLPHLDGCFSAEELPFEDNGLSAIFMLNVFHHIPSAEKFLTEAQRTLKPGGIIFMIEPAHTRVSRFIYRRFHHEPFEPEGDWFVRGGRPLSDSNQAIPWIVFERDRAIFEEKFPKLKIRSIRLHTPFRYLFSGGLSGAQLIPDFLFGTLTFVEKVAAPLHGFCALFQTIEVEKES